VAIGDGQLSAKFPPSLHGSDLWIKESGILRAVVSTKLFLSVWVCSWNLPSTNLSLFLWPLATGNYLPDFPPSLHGSDLWIKESGILRAVVSTQLFLSVWVCSWNLPSTNLSLFCGHCDGQLLPSSFPPSLHGSDLWIKESWYFAGCRSTQTVPECLGVFLESPQHKFKPVLWPLATGNYLPVSRLVARIRPLDQRKWYFAGCRIDQTVFLSVWVCSWNLPSTI